MLEKFILAGRAEGTTPERPSRRRRRRSSSDSESPVQPAKVKRSSGGLTAGDLMKIITALQDSSSKNMNNTNVVPEFDPNNRSQDVERWLRKVNECAAIYKWDEKQTIHYSLQKLAGLAKKWYESLPTLNFSWQEWQCKMKKAFPSEENFGKLLEEMLNRKSRSDETLRDYFYDKLSLLSRCEISGRKAVDCIIYGIADVSVRNGAQALKCSEPEDLLNYLASQQINQTKENSRHPSSSNNNSIFRRRDFRTGFNGQNRNLPTNRGNDITCFNCQERGHSYINCTKPLVKCVKCGRIGHNFDNCYKKPLLSHNNNNQSEQPTDKNVLKIASSANLNVDILETCPVDNQKASAIDLRPIRSASQVPTDVNSKYFKNICVNDQQYDAFIDFGSDCSLVKSSVAKSLDLTKSCDGLPIIRGFGNSVIKPDFRSTITVRIDEVETKLDVLAVDDAFLPASLLIGQNFTELPSVMVKKDSESLFFYFKTPEKLAHGSTIKLFVKKDTIITKGGLVEVYCKEPYSGDIYIDGDTRTSPNQEYHLHQGCYKISDKTAIIFVTSLTTAPLIYKADTLIARVNPIVETRIFAINTQNQCSELPPLDKSEIKAGQNIDLETIERLHKILNKYRSCFAQNLGELGCAKNTQMNIELDDKTPIVYRPYRLSYHERQKVREIVDDLLNNDIVQESVSNYASPILIVKKKNGESRLCVDYRALNNKTIKDKYPLPLIDDQISNLSGNNFFTTLDLASGYYQIPMSEESRHITAFVTPDGHYEFKRMPFGLANAPAVFQKMINRLLGQRRFDSVLAYMDDLLIPSATIDQGFQKLEEILKLIQDAGLTLKLSKCRFFDREIEYLGYEVSADGIRPSQRKIAAVRDFPMPTNIHELRQFLGLASYFRRFVKGFGEIARSLTKLLKKDVPWQWTVDQDNSFKSLKSRLIERPLLALYDPNLETELHTDASSLGLGGILMQWQSSPRVLKPVAYFSRQTTAEEKFFHSYELETLAVVCSLKKFRPYLLGLKFSVYTDCNALRTTLTKRDLIPRIARWWLQISDFDFNIEYRPGCRMLHVDALSRNPPPNDSTDSVKTLNITSGNWIITLQIADPELQRIMRILKPNMEEENTEIKKNYAVKNHTLYRKVGDDLRLVVPKSARWQICKSNHDDIGHFGFAKTVERIQSQYWFPKLRRFVKKYVAACIECAYNKDNTSRTRKGFIYPIPKIEKPFHTLHLDHLGPFVRSKTGNCYILTIVDAFTKYIFARPVKDTKTKNVVRVLKHLFEDFGVPTRIISDRGTAFTSGPFKEFCCSNGIKHVLNAVACPRANGQAERFNQTILTSLSSQNFGKDERTWDEQLGKVQWGINNTINATTKKCPSELLFGTKLSNTSDNMLMVEDEETSQLTDSNTIVGEHETSAIEIDQSATDSNHEVSDSSALKEIRREASLNISESQKRMKNSHDSKRSAAKLYSVGDLVKVTKTNFYNDGKSKKLMPKFIGPYKISKSLGNDRYEIVNVPGFNSKRYKSVVAADRIRPWIHVKAYELNKSSGSESSSSSDSDSSANRDC